VSDNIT